jgi:hypothetical protein
MLEASVVRSNSWLWLVLTAALVIAAGSLGVLAIQQATEISAYHHAHACSASAGVPANASCLRAVDGSVAGVTENSTRAAYYALDVQTASGTLRLTFSSDSTMLRSAVDGDPAVVTTWRGVPVSVETNGRSEVTTSAPDAAFACDLGYAGMAGGLAMVFASITLWLRRREGADSPQPSSAYVAASLTLLFGGIVVMAGGIALRAKPSAIGIDLVATGSALAVVLAFVAWLALGVRMRRQTRGYDADLARALERAEKRHRPHHGLRMPFGLARHTRILATARQSRTASPAIQPPTRLSEARWVRVLSANGHDMAPVLLLTAVLFGVFFTSKDGPPARAFRHAPACAGETNLATCVGSFTAVVIGVRSPADDANGASVSYVTQDGVINGWAEFGGNSLAVTSAALADQRAGTERKIRVWRRSIVAAQLGGSLRWTIDNPPGNTVPAIFLAVSFALLLTVVRLGIHSEVDSRTSKSRVLIDDVGQVVAAALSISLLAKGFLPGAILALAVLLWLGLSVWQGTRRKDLPLAVA